MRVLGLVVALLFASPLLAAKFYKWTDKDGVVHYDAQPPKGQEATEVQASARAPTAAAPAAAAAAAAPADPAATSATDAVAAVAAANAKVRAEACAAARSNLQTIDSHGSLVKVDPATGARTRMSAEEIAAAKEQATSQVAEYCSPAG